MDSVSVVSHAVYGVTSTSINVAGSLDTSAGDIMNVQVNVKGALKIGGKVVAIILVKQLWRATLTTTLFGSCECAIDGDPLDNRENLVFWCWVQEEGESGSKPEGEWVSDTRFNATTVEYEVLKINNIFANKKDKVLTNNAGFYSFPNQIPIGYFMDVTLKSDDMHLHGDDPIPGNRPIRICKYENKEKKVDTGDVALEVIPVQWNQDI